MAINHIIFSMGRVFLLLFVKVRFAHLKKITEDNYIWMLLPHITLNITAANVTDSFICGWLNINELSSGLFNIGILTSPLRNISYLSKLLCQLFSSCLSSNISIVESQWLKCCSCKKHISVKIYGGCQMFLSIASGRLLVGQPATQKLQN